MLGVFFTWHPPLPNRYSSHSVGPSSLKAHTKWGLLLFSSIRLFATPWTAARQAFHLLELAQTPVHCVGDAIQPSHPLSSPSPSAFNLSRHQSLFQWVSSSHQLAKVLALQLQHQSFQWNGAAAAAAAAKSFQLRPTLCDPIDGSPPGSSVPGILQARTLEWVAISFSSAGKWKVKVKSLSRVRLFVTPWSAAYQAPPSMGVSRQEYWSGLPLPSLEWGYWFLNSTYPQGMVRYLYPVWKNHSFDDTGLCQQGNVSAF